MLGKGYLFIYDYDVLFKGTGSIAFGPQTQLGSVTFTGNGYLLADPVVSGYGRSVFPAFSGQGFEDATDGYGAGSGTFPAFYGGGEATYVPPEMEYGFGFFPAFYGSGTSTTINVGNGNATFPGFIGQGGIAGYGFGGGNFPSFTSFGIEDFHPNESRLFSTAFAYDGIASSMDVIIILNNLGHVVDTITGSTESIASILSSATASGTFTVIGDPLVYLSASATGTGFIGVSRISPVFSQTVTNAATGDESSFDDHTFVSYSISDDVYLAEDEEGEVFVVGTVSYPVGVNASSRVWVVNMDTGASSQYDDYGFNSFFEKDGKYYGVAIDGIYELDGDDDEGLEIDALIDFGSSNYGTSRDKISKGVEIGCSSTGKLYLRVTVDGVQRVYEMRRNYATMKTQTFPISSKHIGSQWHLVLLNQNGCDFDIANINFEILPTTRRSK